MHEHTVPVFIFAMVMFTAGFLICELNFEDLKKIYEKIRAATGL
jgi:hypothetical protein